jgi:hypothetical protein
VCIHPTTREKCPKFLIKSSILQSNIVKHVKWYGHWKYDHEYRKVHQIKRVCGTCYAHEFNLNAFRNEWSYIQYSRRAIDYYIYFIDENKRYSRKCRWNCRSNETTPSHRAFMIYKYTYHRCGKNLLLKTPFTKTYKHR